jgi:hypothetical protein
MTAIQGGGGVSMVHVGKLAVHVLGHRVIVKANMGENQRSANDVIEEILREVQPDQARAI